VPAPHTAMEGILDALRADPALLGLLLIPANDEVKKYKGIVGKRNYYNMAREELRLCVYFRPSRKTENDIVWEDMVEAAAHVPENLDMTAHTILSRVQKILTMDTLKIQNQPIRYAGYMGEMPTKEGFFAVGSRFVFPSIV
jgi:hypothetical protein